MGIIRYNIAAHDCIGDSCYIGELFGAAIAVPYCLQLLFVLCATISLWSTLISARQEESNEQNLSVNQEKSEQIRIAFQT